MEVVTKTLFEGIMVYWDEVENASRYYVHLLIGEEQYNKTHHYNEMVFKEVDVVECDRHKRYYSFKNLSYNLHYNVYVEAEDNRGNIIDESDSIAGHSSNTVNVTW